LEKSPKSEISISYVTLGVDDAFQENCTGTSTFVAAAIGDISETGAGTPLETMSVTFTF